MRLYPGGIRGRRPLTGCGAAPHRTSLKARSQPGYPHRWAPVIRQPGYGNRHRSLRGAYRLERKLQAAMFKSRNTTIARKAGMKRIEPQFRPRTFG